MAVFIHAGAETSTSQLISTDRLYEEPPPKMTDSCRLTTYKQSKSMRALRALVFRHGIQESDLKQQNSPRLPGSLAEVTPEIPKWSWADFPKARLDQRSRKDLCVNVFYVCISYIIIYIYYIILYIIYYIIMYIYIYIIIYIYISYICTVGRQRKPRGAAVALAAAPRVKNLAGLVLMSPPGKSDNCCL